MAYPIDGIGPRPPPVLLPIAHLIALARYVGPAISMTGAVQADGRSLYWRGGCGDAICDPFEGTAPPRLSRRAWPQ
jgi:hypothetical protein